MSNDSVKFDAEIERQLNTPPLEPMPAFKPQVPTALLETIAKYSESERRIVVPILEAWSISDQRQTHAWNVTSNHNNAIRGLERKNLDTRASFSGWLVVVATALISGLTFAIAAHFIPAAK